MLSSVAGERVRRANPVYGATKAGIDGFAQGLGDVLADDGVHMMIVRPGFVITKMTTGLKPAPFSTTPEKVADATVRGFAGEATNRLGAADPAVRVLRVASSAEPGLETLAPWMTLTVPSLQQLADEMMSAGVAPGARARMARSRRPRRRWIRGARRRVHATVGGRRPRRHPSHVGSGRTTGDGRSQWLPRRPSRQSVLGVSPSGRQRVGRTHGSATTPSSRCGTACRG